MEIGFLIFAVLLGAGYVAIIVRGLEKNKPWAHEIARTVEWKGGPALGDLADRPIRLRFELKDTDLFALRFGR